MTAQPLLCWKEPFPFVRLINVCNMSIKILYKSCGSYFCAYTRSHVFALSVDHIIWYTHRYIHGYTHTHICSAHGHRQANTCWRICDYNQINWSISPWKHHIYTWRPLVAFSWMLLTLTRSQAAGAGSAGSQHALWHQHLFMAYMLGKLLQHLQLYSVWQKRNFYLFLWRIPTYLSCTFFGLNLTREKPFSFPNINMKVSVAWQNPRPLQRQQQNMFGFCDEYY